MSQDKEKFERYTFRCNPDQGVDVLGWGTYPKRSVLADQPMKVFLDSFNTPEEAQARFPQATQLSSRLTDPQVSLNHLPGPDDHGPIAGGMYPDDWAYEPKDRPSAFKP